MTYLILEIILLLGIMMINLRGVKAAGHAEFVLAVLKLIPLVAMPILALLYFNSDHIVISKAVAELPLSKALGQVALLTLWGFIGLECATTPAESVENPETTIPKAIIIGTICVALLYIFNSIGMMGLLSSAELSQSTAPYSDAVQRVLGGNWHLVISVIAAVVCIGTLNAWVLTSGQIALGLAQDRFLPKYFQKQNKFDAPFVGIIVSCSGIIPLLFLTADENLAKQITTILDFSVIAFLFVYLACSLSLIRCLIKEKKSPSIFQWLAGIIGGVFCVWVIYETSLSSLLISCCFVLSGLPVYYLWYKKNNNCIEVTHQKQNG
jgi:APA family basic amino acid/polyamine antiporter